MRTLEQPWIVVLVLAGLVGGTRWLGWQQEVISVDESTFIILGWRLSEGYLPYLDLFDNKPPFLFVMFAGIISLFGDSLVAIRLFGDVCVLVTALFVFAISRRLTEFWPALCASVLTILVFAHTRYTSAELPAVALLMGAFWYLVTRRHSLHGVACAGLLISLATLTRTNLGVVAPVFAIFLLATGFTSRRSGIAQFAPVACYALAGLLPVAVIAFVYWIADGLYVLWLSTVEVALNYAANQLSVWEAFVEQMEGWWRRITYRPVWFAPYSVLALCGLLTAFVQVVTRPQRGDLAILLLGFAAIAYSIAISGTAYPFYLLQIYPLGAIFAAIFIERLGRIAWLQWSVILTLVASTLVLLERFAPDGLRSIFVAGFVNEQHTIRHAAEKADAVLLPEDEVWALYRQIVYWYLDHPPPTRLGAHPSNFTRTSIVEPLIEAGYIPENPFDEIYTLKPALIVTDPSRMPPHYLTDPDRLMRFLTIDYAVFVQNPDITIYRRIGHRGWRP